ncbi:MAG: transposase, partial [Cyclobacteriaceae bacterium]|nr:transposase [Cyclobacteriaceae bacterium]
MIELIERWRQSGKSVKGFCKQEGVSPSTLYYWLKKLNGNHKDNPMPTKGFV